MECSVLCFVVNNSNFPKMAFLLRSCYGKELSANCGYIVELCSSLKADKVAENCVIPRNLPFSVLRASLSFYTKFRCDIYSKTSINTSFSLCTKANKTRYLRIILLGKI